MRCIHCGTNHLAPALKTCPECGVLLEELFRGLLPRNTEIGNSEYQIEHVLGKGGFGVTYQAYARSSASLVAIKEYFPQDYARRDGTTGELTYLSRDHREPYEKWMERFKRESQILFNFNHPNIVKVLNLFEERNTVYLVMKLLEGKTLKDELLGCGSKGLPETQVVRIMNALASALAEVHQQNLFHLDLKPDNIMLTQDGEIVLIDFGSARVEKPRNEYSTIARTEKYAPPELMGIEEEISSATDIFELGMLLHEMLTGTLPPLSISRVLGKSKGWTPELPSPWQELVSSALRLDREERPSKVSSWWQRYQRFELRAKIEREKSKYEKYHVEVVRVNATGDIIQRSLKQAQFFVEDLGNGNTILEMALIPGGTFTMGSQPGEEGWDVSEDSKHKVTLPTFYLGKYPITQGQWQEIMGTNPSTYPGRSLPVVDISWFQAVAFCQKLSNKAGRKFRLPSEVEWEYACRAGTTTPFYFGETLTTNLANYQCGYTDIYATGPKQQYRQRLTAVGSFPPNTFGLYDMHGNVWEWCQDTWHATYTGAPTNGDAWVDNGSQRVLRGGSWLSYMLDCRSAKRIKFSPSFRNHYFGFRVALVAPSPLT